jgi:hypothetical protein
MMLNLYRLFLVSLLLVPFGLMVPQRAEAQTYPIDCAILLCLAGGWPASNPCARARAEFIRRITPWPVEPPLQIWRCPMGVSHVPLNQDQERIRDIRFDLPEPPMSSVFPELSQAAGTVRGEGDRRLRGTDIPMSSWPELERIQARADIDISGPAFDFVRSIRVFHVRVAKQKESDNTGDCNRNAIVRLGQYGVQGEFSWHTSSINALPGAHLGLERWGESCPELDHRSVFVDWHDYQGSYGYEQVNY